MLFISNSCRVYWTERGDVGRVLSVNLDGTAFKTLKVSSTTNLLLLYKVNIYLYSKTVLTYCLLHTELNHSVIQDSQRCKEVVGY